MKTAKIKAFHPRMKDGVHASYTNTHGTYYNFDITFEDGTEGGVSSSKEKPSWKVGEEYTFEVVKSGDYTNIKSMKPANGYSGAGGLSLGDTRREVAKGAVMVMFAMGKVKEDQIPAATERFVKLMSK